MKVLRCLTLNLWGAEAPLAERDGARAAGASQTLAPDVVALQEVRRLARACPTRRPPWPSRPGLSFVFAQAVAFRGGHEGLAFLSRLPIVAHESRELPHASDQERRVLLSAALRLGDRPLWVHNTHLNYRLAHGRQREDQVRAIEGVDRRAPAASRRS